MARETSNVPINADYFAEIVSNSGMTHKQFARTVGRTEAFVYNAKSRGYMQLPTAELLCNVHGADLDKLLCVQDEPETVQETNQQQIIFADEETIQTLVKALINIDKKLDLLLKK